MTKIATSLNREETLRLSWTNSTKIKTKLIFQP